MPPAERIAPCKRLLMLARWMVRRGAVDLGLWHGADPAKLIIPLDTHIHRIALRFRWTLRRSADMRTALEVTEALRAFSPQDPTRYDFPLTRLGIRADADLEAFFTKCGV